MPVPEAVPRYATRRRPERPTYGPRLCRTATLLGLPPMPWQAQFADVFGEYDPATGIPFYRSADFTTPRQSGKTSLLLPFSFDRCQNWGAHRRQFGLLTDEPQRIVWTAQNATAAREKWLDEIYPLIERSQAMRFIRLLVRANGAEAIRFKNAGVIRLSASTPEAGHGKTIHGNVQDELFADKDNRRSQALGPASITVEDAQELRCSTAGDDSSLVYNQMRRAGRRAVDLDRGSGTCYLEFSAPDGWDPLDEDSYWEFMPALGHTIQLDAIRHERERMLDDPGEGLAGFRRAYGNVPAGGADEDEVIPAAKWALVCGPSVAPAGRLVIAIAVAEDRSTAAVAVADEHGRVELIEHRSGTGWVADRVNGFAARHGADVVLDGTGPAGSLDKDLEKCRRLAAREVADACGLFHDAVIDGRCAIRRDPRIDAAVSGVVKRSVGDAFRWDRRSSTEDVTPLEAVTLAWWAAHGEAETAADFDLL